MLSFVICYSRQSDAKEALLIGCLKSIRLHAPRARILLASWDRDLKPTPNVDVVPMLGPFCRKRGIEACLAVAAFSSRKPGAFVLLDADVLFTSSDCIGRGMAALAEGKVYFPICTKLHEDGSPDEPWDCAYGTVFLTAEDYWNAGAWKEKFNWGEDDREFFGQLRFRAVRDQPVGLYHQWHEGTRW